MPRAFEGIPGDEGGVASRCESGIDGRTKSPRLDENPEGYTELVVERMGDHADTKVCVCTAAGSDCGVGFWSRDRQGTRTCARCGFDADYQVSDWRNLSMRITHRRQE